MAEPKTIQYLPTPSALRIHNSTARVKCICGPIGSGKTSVALWEWYLLCMESTVPLRGIVMRASYRELQDSTRKTTEEWFGHILTYREADEQAQFRITGIDGVTRTHTLDFRACKREQEVTKLLSTEYAFCWMEEVVGAYITTRDGRPGGIMGQGLPFGVFNIAKMRLRQKGAPRLEIVLTFNPPPTNHWCYREFFRQEPADLERKGVALFRQPPGENAKNLPALYYEQLLEDLPLDIARRFVGGEPVAAYDGERVFPECQEHVHIQDFVSPVPHVPLTGGLDFGLTPCALITQILPGGQWLILGELQLFNKGMRAFIETLGPWLQTEYPGLPVRKFWQDPAGGNQRSQVDETETCGALLRQAGYDVQDGVNTWSLRREIMKQRFSWFPDGKPGIQVSRQHCPLFVEGLLGGYRYPTTSIGLAGSSPIKNALSHLQDAAQMIGTGEFSLLSGMVSKEELAVKEMIRRARYNPLSSTGQPRFNRTAWMRR